MVHAIIDPTESERALAALDHDVATDEEFAELLVVITGLIADRISTVWRVLARTPGRPPQKPMPNSPGLDAVFAHHRERIRLEPGDASRLLRSLTWSLTSPQLTNSPASPDRIVDLFLNGAAH